MIFSKPPSRLFELHLTIEKNGRQGWASLYYIIEKAVPICPFYSVRGTILFPKVMAMFFMVLCSNVREHPKAQPAVVLV